MYFRIDHLYAFFLRWTPDRAADPSFDDYQSDNSYTTSSQTPRHLSHTPLKHNEISPGKGFVLLTNDDPELTDDFMSSNNKSNNSSKSGTGTPSSDSGIDTKKQHYLKRQNTLLKEWEVITYLGKDYYYYF